MNKKALKSVVCILGLVCCSNVSHASSFYIDGSVGPAFAQDLKLRSISGVGALPNVRASFNVGIRGDISLGYKVNKSFALELQSGVIWNDVNKIMTPFGSFSVGTFNSSIEVYQIPILLNAVYTFMPDSKFKPYIGAGLGGVETLGYVHFGGGTFGGTPIPARSADSSDFTFAYQGEVGFKYAVSQSIDVGVGYKFLGSLDHEFSGLKTGPMLTHSVVASVTCGF